METDRYMTSEYEIKQIRDQILTEYKLLTKLLPANISNQMIYDNLLSNQFLITDYNLRNTEIFRRVDVMPKEIDETNIRGQSDKINYVITFEPKDKNTIKTNY